MKFTDKLGLPIWNEPETDVFNIEHFNKGMQTIDNIVVRILNQINDLVIGDKEIDLNGYVKEEVLKEYAKIIANKADKEEIEEISSQLDAKANKSDVETINSQIDNKVNKDDLVKIDLSISNKADKTYVDNKKITMSDLGQDVKQAMTGGSVAVVGENIVDTVNLKDNSVKNSKIADSSITLKKKTIDILPKSLDYFSPVPFTFKIGEVSKKGSYGNVNSIKGIHYRHDTDLIPVEPGATVTIYNNPTSKFKVAINEFDIEKKGVKDGGYQTNEIVNYTLTATTRFIRLIIATKDYSEVDIEEMEDIGISIEISNNDTSVIKNYDENFNNLKILKKNNKPSIISLRKDFWENKTFNTSLTVGESSIDLIYKDGIVNNCLRLTKDKIIPIYYKKYYVRVPKGYCLDIVFIDNNNKFNGIIYYKASDTINDYFICPSGTNAITVRIYELVDSGQPRDIDASELLDFELYISPSNENILKSYEDLEYRILNFYNSVSNNLIQSNGIKYIGHAGTAAYAPENTLAALKIAKIMGMWGAECDLCITSDKQLVLMHDYTVDRTTNGTGRVDSLTLEQIKGLNIDLGCKAFTNVKIPTFEEYLKECKRLNLVPIIEVKNTGIEDGVITALSTILYKMNMWNNVVIISFGKEELEALRARNKDVTLAYLTQANKAITDEDINFVKSLGNACINCHGSNIITQEMIDNCHKKNIPVMVWTVNNDIDRELFETLGVDAITTDSCFNEQRQTKEYKFQVYTNDKGETWSAKIGKTLENISVKVKDNYTLQITVNEVIRTLLQQFDCNIGCVNNSYFSNGQILPYIFKESNGLINIQLVQDNSLIQLSNIKQDKLLLNCIVEL